MDARACRVTGAHDLSASGRFVQIMLKISVVLVSCVDAYPDIARNAKSQWFWSLSAINAMDARQCSLSMTSIQADQGFSTAIGGRAHQCRRNLR